MSRLNAGRVYVALALCAVVFAGVRSGVATDMAEDGIYFLDPTAERAYRYGDRHFNASDPRAYDVDRAEYYFLEAAAQDPSLPYLYHELARISFLKSDFNIALARINLQISLHGTTTPNSYYVRGLIKGFAKDYDGAAKDYETYLRTDPHNWAAINDYAWVLLKSDRPEDALVALDRGLTYWPLNPWLLNSKATAHFELGQLESAYAEAQKAGAAVTSVSEKEWLMSYPGNDPLIAAEGVSVFQKAVEENMHSISVARENAQKNVR